MNESNLIRKIKKGDENAMDILIQSYYPFIYAYVSRKMLMDDCAKDITQEVFLRFLRYLPTYRQEGKLLHYLYRRASNVCKDYYRKMQYHEDISELDYMIEDDTNVHESILNQLKYEELMLWISKLNDIQQDVIILKYFHQLTFKEIADIHHIPVSTVKSRHTQALIKLRKLMKEGGFQHEKI